MNNEDLPQAVRDVIAERRAQVTREGWTAGHDDDHSAGTIALSIWRALWPWDRDWWKPTTPREDLVRAGALILAEIERLDRAADRKARTRAEEIKSKHVSKPHNICDRPVE